MCSPLRCLGMLMKRQGARPLVAPMVLRCSLRIPIPSTGRDGFRMLVRRDEAGVRLFTRNGHDWTGRFPLIARAALSLQGCLVPDRWRGRSLRRQRAAGVRPAALQTR
jgi:hypothetical protein